MRIQLYASPGYLSRCEPIRAPDDLGAHDWIGFTQGPLLLASAGTKLKLSVRQRVLCDDMYFVREVLRQGGGVGALPSFVVRAALVRRGRGRRAWPRFARSCSRPCASVHSRQPDAAPRRSKNAAPRRSHERRSDEAGNAHHRGRPPRVGLRALGR
jgi:DNA-binding transcriptional LysR family regulator